VQKYKETKVKDQEYENFIEKYERERRIRDFLNRLIITIFFFGYIYSAIKIIEIISLK
jgi:hypothetical protein